MLPVVALVGRPNVGKSTLFNQLTRSRDALVSNMPGLTRDRQYGLAKIDDHRFLVVDTGGLTESRTGVEALMDKQVHLAIGEADVVVLVVDAREGLNTGDEQIAGDLRATGKPVVVAVNKVDGADADAVMADFHALGFGDMTPTTASHGRGISDLVEQFAVYLPDIVETAEEEPDGRISIAVVGRPNTGKSTLINRLIGEERVIAFDEPGTTRDSVRVPFTRGGRDFVLIDTAGVRRRARVHETIEKFSIIKTLQAVDASQVVILMLDAQEGVTDQDATILGHIIDQGRALVIAVNKWDRLESEQRDKVRRELDLKLDFCDFAERHFVSGLHGTGIDKLLKAALRARDSAFMKVSTPLLTGILEEVTQRHTPPVVRGRAPRLRYAHQGGVNPVRIIVHGSRTDTVPASYRRYLINSYRKRLKITGAPIRVDLRSGKNPYEGKKNVLTDRQKKRRKRQIKHTRKQKK